MDIRTLENWDYNYILELTKSGSGESDWYDFKKGFPPTENVTHTVCSFANTKAGFFILGIDNSDKTNFKIIGIDRSTELSHIFRQ